MSWVWKGLYMSKAVTLEVRWRMVQDRLYFLTVICGGAPLNVGTEGNGMTGQEKTSPVSEDHHYGVSKIHTFVCVIHL